MKLQCMALYRIGILTSQVDIYYYSIPYILPRPFPFQFGAVVRRLLGGGSGGRDHCPGYQAVQ